MYKHTDDSKILAENIAKSIQQGIAEAFREMLGLDEDKMVSFKGNVSPKYGHAIIMTGGGGSGKGHVISNRIGLNAKQMDVDEFKEKYVRLLNDPKSTAFKTDARRQANPDLSTNGDQLYDIRNSDDTNQLHIQVSGRRWKQKTRDMFFDTNQEVSKQKQDLEQKWKNTTDKDKKLKPKRDGTYKDFKSLPNVIFDVTGKELWEVTDLAKDCHACGYETTLVWVVISRDRAITQALSRERRIPQKVFHNAHNQININMPSYLSSRQSSMDFDNAWVVLNSGEALSPETGIEKTSPAIQLSKGPSGFEMPEDLKTHIERIMGQNEEDPNNPKTYQDFSQVAPEELDYYEEPSEKERKEKEDKGLTSRPIRKNHRLDSLARGKTKAGDNLLQKPKL